MSTLYESLSKHLISVLGQPLALSVVLRQGWWVVRLGLWLCWLPILLRLYPLPALLHRLSPARAHRTHTAPVEMERIVRLVMRLCRLRLFHPPLFPRACLRQALTLYVVLTRLGYPVQIHFGVQKTGETLHGHSWVTVQGRPVAERLQTTFFSIVYSYPSVAGWAPQEAHRSDSRDGPVVSDEGADTVLVSI